MRIPLFEPGKVASMVLVKWALCVAFLSEMAISPAVWTNRPGFPTMPAYPWIPALPEPLCLVLSFGLVASVLAVGVLRSPGFWVLLPVGFGLVLSVFDASRFQPWFFQYGMMFGALALMDWSSPDSKRSQAAWGACAIVVIGVYFWSGLQKINPIFAQQVFPWLIHPFGLSPAFWPVAPVVETSVGVLLFWPRTRWFGLGLAVLMHGFVLLALGPWGQNYDSIVWPWNFWITVLAILLFGRTRLPVLGSAWSLWTGRFVVILMAVMPAFNFFGLWDGFLSASFYSGKLQDGWIYLTAEGEAHLPKAYVDGNKGLVQESPSRYRLDILIWSMSQMNAPPYGEPRFYPSLVRSLRADGVPAKNMVLMVQEPVKYWSSERRVIEVKVP